MNILVTGGSGHLSEYVVKEFADHDLLLTSRTPPPADRAHLGWMQGDLNSFQDCQRVIAECEPEVILHLGAVPYPTDHSRMRERVEAMGWEVPPFDATMRTNVLGTYYLMQAAVQAKVKAVIMTGSNCALGHCFNISGNYFPYQYFPIDERHPSSPEDSYSCSKWMGEQLLASFTRAFGIRTYVTRPGWIRPPEAEKEYAQTVESATGWDDVLRAYVDSRDIAWSHRLIFEAMDRLPPHDYYFIHAADTLAQEDSRELVERFRPDLMESIPVNLQGRDTFFSWFKAYNSFGYKPRYSWTDFVED